MNHLFVGCDCDGNPAEPEMNDVGIIALYDSVALDQSYIDIVYNIDRSESGALIEIIESRNDRKNRFVKQRIQSGKN